MAEDNSVNLIIEEVIEIEDDPTNSLAAAKDESKVNFLITKKDIQNKAAVLSYDKLDYCHKFEVIIYGEKKEKTKFCRCKSR